MSKRRVFQYATQNLATAAFTLTPRAGKGYRILDIGGAGAAAGQGLVVTVHNERMLFLPAINALSNVAFPKFISLQTAGFFEQVRARFPQVPLISAGADQGITIERANAAGACTAYVWWEELDGEDIPDPASPGGSDNEDRLIIQLGQETFTIAAASTEIETMTTAVMPSGFRPFPFGEVIPTNVKLDWLGAVIGYDAAASANTTCNGVRVWLNEQSVLTTDENFCPITVFPPTNTGADQRLGLFQEAIPVESGDKMTVQYSFTNAAGAAETPLIHCALLFHQHPIG
jgi:hypothetical protein